MKPCEVGHSKTLPTPRAAGGRRKEKGKGNAGWRMGKQKGQQLSARALALPFSPTLTLSCAYERDCVCVCASGVWVWIVCNPSRDVGSCWVHCPCSTLCEAYRRAGGRSVGQACGLSVGLVGNIAEIVYHVANGCVVIIVTEPKVRKGEKERQREWKDGCEVGSQLVYARKTCKKNRKKTESAFDQQAPKLMFRSHCFFVSFSSSSVFQQIVFCFCFCWQLWLALTSNSRANVSQGTDD